MSEHHCLALNSTDSVAMLESIECGDDDAPLQRAEKVLAFLRKRGRMLRLMEKKARPSWRTSARPADNIAHCIVKSGYKTIADETPRAHWFASRIDALTWVRESGWRRNSPRSDEPG